MSVAPLLASLPAAAPAPLLRPPRSSLEEVVTMVGTEVFQLPRVVVSLQERVFSRGMRCLNSLRNVQCVQIGLCVFTGAALGALGFVIYAVVQDVRRRS